MTNYFKVYLKPLDGGWERTDVKTSKEVRKILQRGLNDDYERFLVIKSLENRADVIIAGGCYSKKCKVVYVDGLDTDWRIVGANVVDWDKYKKFKEGEER